MTQPKITDFIDGKVTFDSEGGYFFVQNAREGFNMLAQMRGWGAIHKMKCFKTESGQDLNAAAKFQDELGEFIANAINEKIEREKV
jgi:hypothetical protein